jgi:hypothetical protein
MKRKRLLKNLEYENTLTKKLEGTERFPYSKNLCHYNPFILSKTPIKKTQENNTTQNYYTIKNTKKEIVAEIKSTDNLPQETADIKTFFHILALAYRNKKSFFRFKSPNQALKFLKLDNKAPKKFLTSLDRLSKAHISFDGTFYDYKKKSHIKANFGFLSYSLEEETRKTDKSTRYGTLTIAIDQIFLDILFRDMRKDGYHIWVDLTKLQSMQDLLSIKAYLQLECFPTNIKYKENLISFSEKKGIKVNDGTRHGNLLKLHKKSFQQANSVINPNSRITLDLNKKVKGQYEIIIKREYPTLDQKNS